MVSAEPVTASTALTGLTSFISKLSGVVWPYFSRKHNPNYLNVRFRFLFMFLMLVGESFLLVSFSYTYRDFNTAMTDRDKEGFYHGIQKYFAILVVVAPYFAACSYVQSILALEWRTWLTGFLCEKYFKGKMFYELKNGGWVGQVNETGGAYESTAASSIIEDQERDGRRRQASAAADAGGEDQRGDIEGASVDNPDARIGEDLQLFTANTITIMVAIVSQNMRVASFVGVLLKISGRLTLFVVAYSLVGTFLTVIMFGGKLKHLTFEVAKKEANFRFGLMRVREHAEEIAFYHGGSREAGYVASLYSQTADFIKDKLLVNFQLNVVQQALSNTTSVLPYLVMAERYFSREFEFGTLGQTAMAYRIIQGGLSTLLTQLQGLSSLAAQTDRLEYLLVSLQEVESNRGEAAGPSSGEVEMSAKNTFEELKLLRSEAVRRPGLIEYSVRPSGLAISSLSLSTPDGRAVIAKDVSFVLTPPQSLLIFGGSGEWRYLLPFSFLLPSLLNPSESLPGFSCPLLLCSTWLTQAAPTLIICLHFGFGYVFTLALAMASALALAGVGKSSLLRAICSLWKVGSGTISSPEHGLFLPQKPYSPLGSLKEQLTYPDDEHGSNFVPDAQLEAVLKEVNLGYVCDRMGGLSSVADWTDVLSLGEQQRLAVARLLLRPPSIAFLDEATSALDQENEAKLYTKVKQSCPCFVSIGHRESLFNHHSHVLLASGGGSGEWELLSMAEFQARRDRH
ncbi:unnamed protein product [Chrysoparadoxa australica]